MERGNRHATTGHHERAHGLESERRLSKVSRENERVLGAKILHLYPDLV
jgi:hypothetical protein